MNKRWYDVNPTLSLLIKLIGEADIETRNFCLNYIIERAKEADIDSYDDFDFIWQRQDDKTDNFKEAMEYFKKMDEYKRTDIALFLIRYIQSGV